LAVVNLGAGALGLWRPFGILGVARPSTFSLLTQHYGDGDDDNDAVLLSNELLIHLLLSRMCFALNVTVGLLLVCVSNESLRIRHIVLRLVCTGTAVYSAGEVWIDTPVALRLGLNMQDPTQSSSLPIQFVLEALNGASFVIFLLAVGGMLLATISLISLRRQQEPQSPVIKSSKKD
jgi:hypothetical protein